MIAGLFGGGLIALVVGIVMSLASAMQDQAPERAPLGVWLILAGTMAMLVACAAFLLRVMG